MSITVTTEGNELLTNAILAGKKITFDQIELVADTIKSPQEMCLRVDVTSVKAEDENTIAVKAMVDNAGFKEDYYFGRVNLYAGETLFAYDDGCSILIPKESVKVINALEMRITVQSTAADLKIIYGSYVLQKDFDDLQKKVTSMMSEVDTLKKEVLTDISGKVDWNNQCDITEIHTMGNMVFFRATYKTDTGYSESMAQIPLKYCPKKNTNLNVVFCTFGDGGKMAVAELNALNGNIDIEVTDQSSGSSTGLISPVIVEGFWVMR